MTQPWVPFGADTEKYFALTDGIPPWLETPVRAWVKNHFVVAHELNAELIQNYDIQTRQTNPISARLRYNNLGQVVNNFSTEETFLVLDYLINVNANQNRFFANEALESVLEDGGSAWRVGTRNSKAGLEQRVPEGVREAAELAMATPGNAGVLLSEAWRAAFGLHPDYEVAYAKAVKAVEAASIPVVSPQNRAATLGSVAGQLRDQGDWGLAMSRSHSTHTTAAVMLGMVQALWTGHNDRHAGQPGYQASTRSDAEAAIFLAVPLVQWFSSGAVARGN